MFFYLLWLCMKIKKNVSIADKYFGKSTNAGKRQLKKFPRMCKMEQIQHPNKKQISTEIDLDVYNRYKDLGGCTINFLLDRGIKAVLDDKKEKELETEISKLRFDVNSLERRIKRLENKRG